MGLRKLFRDRKTLLLWAPAVAIAFATTILQAGGDELRRSLRWARQPLSDGEFFRLVSGHFVHLNWSHWALNVTGLVLVWFLVGRLLRGVEWLLVTAVCIAAIDTGLWLGLPALDWYVGLSGILHGMFAAGVVAGVSNHSSEAMVFGGLLVAKLVYESLAGPLPGSEGTVGGAVITEAHLFGALGGATTAGVLVLRGRGTSD